MGWLYKSWPFQRLFVGDPPKYHRGYLIQSSPVRGWVITYKRHPAVECRSLSKSSTKPWIHLDNAIVPWVPETFPWFRRMRCFQVSQRSLQRARAGNPGVTLPKLKMEFLKMMVPKEITVPFSDSMLNLWEGRGDEFLHWNQAFSVGEIKGDVGDYEIWHQSKLFCW